MIVITIYYDTICWSREMKEPIAFFLEAAWAINVNLEIYRNPLYKYLDEVYEGP